MIEGDDADTLSLAMKIMQLAGEGVGIKALDRMHLDIEIAPHGSLQAELVLQHLDESVGADRQHEIEPDLFRLCFRGDVIGGEIAKAFGGCEDDLTGAFAHAAAVIDDAIDRGRRYAGFARNIEESGSHLSASR